LPAWHAFNGNGRDIMSARSSNIRHFGFLVSLTLLFAFTLGEASLFAQQDRAFTKSYDKSSSNQDYDRTRAVPLEQSRAQAEADQLVSLSSEKIISLLTAEPGLLLKCKKLLVRTAFEQGRVLGQEDLTDDAVFQLVRDDQKVRSQFTREIEDRFYIRAKPTQTELEKNWMAGMTPLLTGSTPTFPTSISGTSSNSSSLLSGPLPSVRSNQGQEDQYWQRHEDDLERVPNPYFTFIQGFPQSSVPGGAAQSPKPPSTPGVNTVPSNCTIPNQQMPQQNYDPRRTLLQAQSSGAFADYYDSGDANGLSGTGPGSVSSLVSARLGGSTGIGGGGMSGSSGTFGTSGIGGGSSLFGQRSGSGGGGTSGLSSPFGGSGTGSSGGSFNPFGGPTPLPQQATLNPGATSVSGLQGPYYQYQLSPLDIDRQPPIKHRPNPYADIPSLYDLYQQYARRSPILDRFGIDLFQNGTGNFDDLPMDMPVGPEYVLGPGDDVSVDFTGSLADHLTRAVDRTGRLVLPEAGGIQVSGKTLGEAQQLVLAAMRTQYRDIRVDISLARVRSVRVYVVGDVEHPGPYDVLALSTPLNAVYQAGGPTSGGSLRIFKHYRGAELIEQVDVYNLLLHGVPAGMHRLEAGDTILVPPLRSQVTIEGMVRRPAIYELNQEKSLAEVLEIAGGVLPSGTLRHVDVERLVAHDTRSMLRLDIPENNSAADVTKALQDFQIQDGDKIKVSPILPYADKTVFLEGHVFRPGKFAYRDGMKVTDLIKSYKDLLPEPYKQHAEIIRLQKPDNTPEVLAFNLGDALDGKDQELVLQPFDTVRVFGRFDFEDTPVITVTGEVRDPGDHITNGAAYLLDAVYLAGGITSDALVGDAQVFRKTDDGKLRVFSVNLRRAMDGDPKDNILLAPKDRVFVHRDLNKVDPATVTIQGEVGRPGKYPLGAGMSATDLVQFAGGLKRVAYTEEADLTSYMVEHGSKVVSDHQTVQIGRALAGEPDTDVRLHDGDVLAIRQLSGWDDLGAVIQVKGEVAHPGGYGIQPGERLSSVIARAGGFLPNSYPYGAVFERVQVRELEEKSRADLLQRVQAEVGLVRPPPGADLDQQVQAKAAVLQYQKVIEQLQNTPPVGRLVIHISSDVKRWANTSADIQVRAGDVIRIPKKPGIVLVDGAVYNPTAITYKPGRSAGWYLKQAGGPTNLADKRGIFVVRADGSVVGGAGGVFSGGVQSAELRPGDMVVVPEQTYSFGTKFKTVLQTAQLAASAGIATYYFAKY
jgi:protein involved in polysaccharide export with SLBB domain